jgi:peptidoglycan hydrolase CwlO-like protein
VTREEEEHPDSGVQAGCAPTGKPTKMSGIVRGVGKCRSTQSGLRYLAGRLVALVVVTTTAAMMVLSSAPVGADQVSNLKSRAAQLSQDLVLEQLQIGAHQQQSAVDSAKVQQDEAEIGSTQKQISSDAQRVSRDRKRLQSEAVSAYIHMDPQSAGNQALFSGNQSEAFARAEYEQVTSGDTSLAIDVLHTDVNQLQAERATLQQQEAQDQITTNEEVAQGNAARQTQTELSSKQSEITGQLGAAVAQQQALQAAAAARAVRAAQEAAATATSSAGSAGTTPSPSGATPAPPGASTGSSAGNPSLPPFLQCVLRVESGGNYGAVSPGGAYMGGFQFSQPTWNEAAQLAGMPQLINVPPNDATPAEQDDLAIALYQADGEQPWDDSCRNG